MGNRNTAFESWVEKHPYLREVAQLQQVMAGVMKEHPDREPIDIKPASLERAIGRGIPVLREIALDRWVIEEAANLFLSLAEALAVAKLPPKIVQGAEQIRSLLSKNPDLAGPLIGEVITANRVISDHDSPDGEELDKDFTLFLAWIVLARVLEPLKRKMTPSLTGRRWRRGYCPLCGQLPAMAQLVRTGKGRERLLSCSCCNMKWEYRRIGCPYCGNEDQDTLKILEITEEPELRIDTCEKCRCYLKTYTAEGNEKVILADWTTLHLDFIGKNQGFQRSGYQMYGV